MTRPLVAPHIDALKPYVPGKPVEELERELGITGAIKLASNENPLGPSPMAVAAMREAMGQAHIYADGSAYRVREAFARYAGIPMEEVVTGNGSNELLTLVARTFCLPGDHAVISDYSFVAYRVIMQAEGMVWASTPVKGDFETDVDALLAAVKPETRLVFLANPNNPTGTYLTEQALTRLLTEIPPEVIVVVDEAYHEYVQASDYKSALELRHLRERLLVTRTFSKVYGLGGVRLGFMVGPEPMIGFVQRVREPFNCSIFAQVAGVAALADHEFVARSVEVNEQGRAIMEAGLAELAGDGVTWTPSQTNFLLVHVRQPGVEIYDRMLRDGVIVRPMGPYQLPNSLRITIGTPEECARCLAALTRAVRA
jgi:histidinol-phosphate aminotransferase